MEVDPESVIDEEMEPDPELNRITNAIIGAAIEVHKELGPGYLESVYEAAMAIEFERRGIKFIRQYRFAIFYRGKKVGIGRADFLVEEQVIFDLKAVETLSPVFTSQVISYMKATEKRLAIIINFNVRWLVDGIKRVAR